MRDWSNARGIIGIAITALFTVAPVLLNLFGYETFGLLAPYLKALETLAPIGVFAGGFLIGVFAGSRRARGKVAAAERERDEVREKLAAAESALEEIKEQRVDDRRYIARLEADLASERQLSVKDLQRAYTAALKADREDPSRLWKGWYEKPVVSSAQLRPSQWPEIGTDGD